MNTRKLLGLVSTLQYNPPSPSSQPVPLGSPCHLMHTLAFSTCWEFSSAPLLHQSLPQHDLTPSSSSTFSMKLFPVPGVLMEFSVVFAPDCSMHRLLELTCNMFCSLGAGLKLLKVWPMYQCRSVMR